ncbi:MarR family transcriptional regulator [Peribacillus psychrosaccharolyticus]|uniref:HTH-type transcriptional regulator SarZ n=1 Tax=Peribacillus psychrosaccharolyticus TaxID=1407 RepID=A0A974RZP0_PERPY|nr:MarR family transcriptional regulator [Peribacillus psychrosaccharolyticus]MEC2054632.1 MarR family transcriptional regulator [Peribacillus psychrosaccharolyticus]MED3744141.1 MarR family transcriptional regulator [Peribacillus psychrosaccharolyticus]QQS99633.1 MarR family transcriptional regulator [Peribacillus psychrosaccharolyticus]
MSSKVSLLNQYWTDIYFHLHYLHKEKISHQVVRILQLVDKQEEIGVNEIASYLQVSHNTASEHIKRLIEKNYLIKGRDPLDERKVNLCLTDLGKEVLHRNTSLDEEKLERVLSELDDNEKNLVENALKILSERAKQCT